MNNADRDAWITLLKGYELDQYRVGDYRASGQFSLVFEAEHVISGSKVALKIMLPNARPEDLYEFTQEAELLAALERSTNVVNLIKSDSGSILMTGPGGTQVPLSLHFHALELADGSLEELVAQRENIALRERLAYWRSTVRGVHQMHRKQIVHRDLKSGNCLAFMRVEIKERCKISDLGRAVDTTRAAHLPPINYIIGRGDFRFAPPECLFAQASRERKSCKLADLYGLGSLLFEVVTGQGITSQALGHGPDIVQTALAEARAGRQIDLSSLQSKYTDAYLMFENSLPKALKEPATKLLKQLCNPVPEERLPRRPTGRSVDNELEWLLRRADILIKIASISASGRRSYRTRRG
jgi:serine/threonine protein kinase